MTLCKAFVILEIDYDDYEADYPDSWDWRELLDLAPTEDVRVNVFRSENDMFDALYTKGLRKAL